MAAPGANPRKFAEKIAQHVQKGAEEEAEFRKIMAELAAVKQGDRVSDMASPYYSLVRGVLLQSFSLPELKNVFCHQQFSVVWSKIIKNDCAILTLIASNAKIIILN